MLTREIIYDQMVSIGKVPAQDISGSRQHNLYKPGIIWHEADTHTKSFLKWHAKYNKA